LDSAAPKCSSKIDIGLNDFENNNPKLVEVKTKVKTLSLVMPGVPVWRVTLESNLKPRRGVTH
jgi:hypothetical protein